MVSIFGIILIAAAMISIYGNHSSCYDPQARELRPSFHLPVCMTSQFSSSVKRFLFRSWTLVFTFRERPPGHRPPFSTPYGFNVKFLQWSHISPITTTIGRILKSTLAPRRSPGEGENVGVPQGESNKKHNVIFPALLFLLAHFKKLIFKTPATMKLLVSLNLLIVALAISPALSIPTPIPDGGVGLVEWVYLRSLLWRVF